MPAQAMPYIWMVVGILIAVMLLVLSMVLWELRKTMKAISDISERISILTDVKGWFDFFNRFKKKKKD